MFDFSALVITVVWKRNEDSWCLGSNLEALGAAAGIFLYEFKLGSISKIGHHSLKIEALIIVSVLGLTRPPIVLAIHTICSCVQTGQYVTRTVSCPLMGGLTRIFFCSTPIKYTPGLVQFGEHWPEEKNRKNTHRQPAKQDLIFLHIPSSSLKIGLHTKTHLPGTPRSR